MEILAKLLNPWEDLQKKYSIIPNGITRGFPERNLGNNPDSTAKGIPKKSLEEFPI